VNRDKKKKKKRIMGPVKVRLPYDGDSQGLFELKFNVNFILKMCSTSTSAHLC
jgi:hypothetical protein